MKKLVSLGFLSCALCLSTFLACSDDDPAPVAPATAGAGGSAAGSGGAKAVGAGGTAAGAGGSAAGAGGAAAGAGGTAAGAGGTAAGAGGTAAGAGGTAAGAGGTAAGAGGTAAGAGGTAAGAGGSAGAASGVTSKLITAAEGGTLADAAGNATLVVPPGALAKDTTLTLAVAPAKDGSVSSVYDFGPDGTMFTVNAKLGIKAPVEAAPAGKVYALGVYEAGAWKEVPGSKLEGGVVNGTVAHFTSFAIILTNGQLIAGGACADEIAAFKPCGGALSGTYGFEAICLTDKSIATPQCPGLTGTGTFESDQTVTFDGMSSVTSAGNLTISSEVVAPKTCYATSGTFDCSTLSKTDANGVVTTCTDTGTTCTCKSKEVKPSAAKTELYTVSGNEFTAQSIVAEFCVSDDRIRVKQKQAEGIFYILKKKLADRLGMPFRYAEGHRMSPGSTASP